MEIINMDFYFDKKDSKGLDKDVVIRAHVKTKDVYEHNGYGKEIKVDEMHTLEHIEVVCNDSDIPPTQDDLQFWWSEIETRIQK